MQSRPLRDGPDRHARRKSHSQPDRIIEKRQNWQDYLDPEEDPGLLDEEELTEGDGDSAPGGIDPDETDKMDEMDEDEA